MKRGTEMYDFGFDDEDITEAFGLSEIEVKRGRPNTPANRNSLAEVRSEVQVPRVNADRPLHESAAQPNNFHTS